MKAYNKEIDFQKRRASQSGEGVVLNENTAGLIQDFFGRG